MNFAMSSAGIPHRSKIDSVCRTQESGDREIRQSVLRTRGPCRRPRTYQTEYASKEATTATERNRTDENYRSPASELATTRTGSTGCETPRCSSRTLAEYCG